MEYAKGVLACVENRIGAEGARAMADALMVNQTLINIYLSGKNRVGGCESAMRRTDLTRARVGNQLGDDGARALAEAMLMNRTVTNVILSSKCGSSGIGNTMQPTDVRGRGV